MGGRTIVRGEWVDQMVFEERSPATLQFLMGQSRPSTQSDSIRSDAPERTDWFSMVQRVTVRTVITGAPGIGKTRLVQWIRQAISQDQIPGLRVPLLLDALDFAIQLQRDSNLTPAEFVLRSVCSSDDEAMIAAGELRERCSLDPDTLLIVDNWDAVPLPLRRPVLEKLTVEELHFESIVTARSIPSEWMRTHSNQPISSFEMTHPDSRPVNQSSCHANRNAYWCELISHARSDQTTRCFRSHAIACEQAISWERQRVVSTCEEQSLDFSHLQVLAQLAFETLSDRSESDRSEDGDSSNSPMSVHRIERLASKSEVDPWPIFRSRILQALHSVSDPFVFSDQRIHCYLASVYVTEQMTLEQQLKFLHHALCHPSLFEVLKNATALSERFRETLWHEFPQLIAQDDRFYSLLNKLVELAVIADWSTTDLSSPSVELRDRVWFAIRQREQSSSCRVELLVESLKNLDSKYLMRRAFNDLDPQHPILSMIKEPRRTDFHRSLGAQGSSVPLSFSDLHQCLRRIAALPPNHPEVTDSLSLLAHARAGLGQSMLMTLAQDESLSDSVRSLALQTIGVHATEETKQTIARIFSSTAGREVRQAILRLASQQSICLDLRCLEIELFEHSESVSWPNALAACLVSYPARDAMERKRIGQIFSTLISEGFRKKSDQFDSTWMAFDQARAMWGSSEQRLSSVDLLSWTDCGLLSNATAVLNEFIQRPQTSDLQFVQRAAAVLRHSVYEETHIHLLDAVGVAVHEADQDCSDYRAEQIQSLLDSLVETIAKIEPAILLEIPFRSECIESALEKAMNRRHWLLYDDRILDQRMRTIARRSQDPCEKHRASTPEVVQQIMEDLPPRQRNDFLSYWHIISEGNEDYLHSDRESVHQAICVILDSDTHTLLSERLQACYQESGPPSFGSWKKNLARVVQRCGGHPEWLAHLERIGLTSNRRRPR